MIKSKKRVELVALLPMVTLALWAMGCSHDAQAASPESQSKLAKRLGGNAQQAQAFLDALANTPSNERKSYILAHPSDARNLAKVPDPKLQERYQSLART
ncbi:MAG TPA: hypothetical protein VGL56_04085 [Fimbriimonadaceae bacterium]